MEVSENKISHLVNAIQQTRLTREISVISKPMREVSEFSETSEEVRIIGLKQLA